MPKSNVSALDMCTQLSSPSAEPVTVGTATESFHLKHLQILLQTPAKAKLLPANNRYDNTTIVGLCPMWDPPSNQPLLGVLTLAWPRPSQI